MAALTVLYFASLRDAAGRDSERVDHEGDLRSLGCIGVIPGNLVTTGGQVLSETGTATGDGKLRSEASMTKSKPKSTQAIEFFSLIKSILPSVWNQS